MTSIVIPRALCVETLLALVWFSRNKPQMMPIKPRRKPVIWIAMWQYKIRSERSTINKEGVVLCNFHFRATMAPMMISIPQPNMFIRPCTFLSIECRERLTTLREPFLNSSMKQKIKALFYEIRTYEILEYVTLSFSAAWFLFLKFFATRDNRIIYDLRIHDKDKGNKTIALWDSVRYLHDQDHRLYGIMFDIFYFSSLFETISFIFIPSLANSEADLVAKSALAVVNNISGDGE